MLSISTFTPEGYLIEPSAPAINGSYGRNDAGEGSGTIVFALTSSTSVLAYGYLIQVLRDGAVDLETTWVIEDIEISPLGLQTLTAKIVDLRTWLLKGRIVAYRATSPQAQKASVRFDHMMRAIIRENFGSLAVETNRQVARLTIQPDVTPVTVASGNKAFSQRECLAVLNELAQASAQNASPVFLSFDVTSRADPTTWIFQVYYGQRGQDRSSLVLSASLGHIDNPIVAVQGAGFKNQAYVGGAQAGLDRVLESVPSSGQPTDYLRREVFVDARQSPSAALGDEGRAVLRRTRIKSLATGKVSIRAGLVFGRDYFYGDRLTADFGIAVLPVMIHSVRVQFRGQNATTVDAQFRSL